MVTVTDGIDSCAASVAAGGCSLSLTTVGSRTLVAGYEGDANFTAASSAGVSHAVNQLASTTVITAHTPEPTVVGQGISVDVTVSGSGTAPGGTVTVTDQTDNCVANLINGSGSCVLTATTSGNKTLTATYGGDANYLGSASSGVTHQVDAFGGVDPASSTATVPDGVAGNVTTIVIVTRDQFGNLVGAGGAAVTLDISGANPGSAAVTDNGDGTYTAEYTPAVAGIDTISVQINAVPVQGSPFTSTVS
jgi:hypothetical protein